MKKVVSIALFGDSSKKDGSGTNYHAYLPTFVLAHHNLFTRAAGWELHVHVDPTTMESKYGRMLTRLAEAGLADVTNMGEAVLTRAMLWRMAPVYRSDADYVFCRDIDSLPSPRDRLVCDVFISSNCAAHTVHDSLSHAGIMGGLCGFQSQAFKNATRIHSLQALYDFAKKDDGEWARHGTDQDVLNRLIDRGDGPTLLEHRYNGWHAGPDAKQKREKGGMYRCKSWSSPTPNSPSRSVGNLSVRLCAEADLLANHLGAAGYDIARARAFWEEHGDPGITKLVRASEEV